ncbi:MAG: Maf family nucleotide pyrophosphatase [Cyclobacteriaceae bacterium]
MNSTPLLILGSNSPRRKEILKEAGYHFSTLSLDIDESYPDSLPKKSIALHLAELKNTAYRQSLVDEVLITADTTVIINDESLEKAQNTEQAVEMLEKLSGNFHEVITGYCISNGQKTCSNFVTTTVHFKKLSRQEIDHYIEVFKPFDKAGAYGIQEWIGMIGISKIEGSYFNVVGLPIFEISEDLKKFGIDPYF